MSGLRKTENGLPPLREKIDDYSYANRQSIGKGFSSSVYRGKDDRTDEHVAIKVIDMKNMKGEVHKNLLAGEIEILNTIKNKANLLDVKKIHSEKNKTFIVTDYCDGGDLGKYLKSKKKLSETDAIRMIKEVIKGYESLYNLGVVHRDLKPANIFFKDSHLKIGDFGFAVKEERLRQIEKYNVGSPIYMPPEALSSNRYSHKSDIWAIGVIFYEMLTGNTPWNGRTENQLKNKMKTISIKNLLPSQISKASSSFLKKSLSVDINKRLEPFEMFSYFDVSHENEEEDNEPEPSKQIYSSQARKNRFRSMRKQLKTTEAENKVSHSIRADPMKKTMANGLKQRGLSKGSQLSQTNTKIGLNPRSVLGLYSKQESLTAIQKRIISKQLLSQIHFCRFIFKIISIGRHSVISEQLEKEMIQFLFYKLKETKDVKLISKASVSQYLECSDYKKLESLIQEYIIKYTQKLNITAQINEKVPQKFSPELYANLTNTIAGEVRSLHNIVRGRDRHNVIEREAMMREVIVLDYLVTLIQLIVIVKNEDLGEFHFKSKIQNIVEGQSITDISSEHIEMIEGKLLRLGLI